MCITLDFGQNSKASSLTCYSYKEKSCNYKKNIIFSEMSWVLQLPFAATSNRTYWSLVSQHYELLNKSSVQCGNSSLVVLQLEMIYCIIFWGVWWWQQVATSPTITNYNNVWFADVFMFGICYFMVVCTHTNLDYNVGQILSAYWLRVLDIYRVRIVYNSFEDWVWAEQFDKTHSIPWKIVHPSLFLLIVFKA